MSEIALDAQTDFLAARVGDGRIVWVFLINGIRLTGSIASFDTHAVLLLSPNGSQMVYKHAIATLCDPYSPIFRNSEPLSATVARRERRPPRRPRE